MKRITIINNIVIKSLRQHPTDVLHGSQNLALQLPHHRKPSDWDLYSYSGKKRAKQLEQKLDKKFGYNIATVHSNKWYDKGKKIKLYQVDTPVRGGDIDLINRTHKLKTIRRKGITVLTLKQELEHKRKAVKEYGRKTKSKQDIKYIKKYFNDKKKRYI